MEIDKALIKFKQFLQSVMPFNEEEFNMALPFFELKILQKGDFFVKENTTCRYFGFVVSGLMRAFSTVEGKEITSCLCNENAFATSTVSFILQSPSNVSIQALEKVVLLVLSYSDLQKLYKQSIFWQTAGRIIAEKEIIWYQAKSWRNSSISATDKYKTLLHENPEIIQKVPLQYIASYLNIQPETLSRIRKKIVTTIS